MVVIVPLARSRTIRSVPGSFFFSFRAFASPSFFSASGSFVSSGFVAGFTGSIRYATNFAPCSAILKLLTRSTVDTLPLASAMIPRPLFGWSSGFFLSFFALSTSAFGGATVKATYAPSAVIDTGALPRGLRYSTLVFRLRATISPSPSCGTSA